MASSRNLSGCSVAIFTGDAKDNQEAFLVDTYGDAVKSTIYKVGHHGSSSSTKDFFLDKVDPEVAVISCGRNNPYGHPHWEVLDILQRNNIKIYRTDYNGDIMITTDGDTYNIISQRKNKE